MNKIWLITKREYVTRVKNKTFLLTTFLAPIGFLLFFLALGFVMSRGSDDLKTIYVLDEQNLLNEELSGRDNLEFKFSKESLDELKADYAEEEFAGILQLQGIERNDIEKYDIIWHSDDQLALDESQSIERVVRRKVRDYKLKALEIDESKLESLDTRIKIVPKTILADKEVSSMTGVVGSILGGVVGYVLFFIILIYGMQVMRSVMEEKINRIVEVLISSVTPFQLMMGKVIGVGLVGLTQIGLWTILFPIIFGIGSTFFGIDSSPDMMDMANNPDIPDEVMAEGMDKIAIILREIGNMNWWMILPLLIFYFLGGYFAYAALFAAVGSAVGEDINEAQSLTLPIMLPLMFAVYIGVSAINAPDGDIVVWASIIPLLSSIVMPVRLPSDPAAWQIILSVVLLIGFVFFFTWLAGRIYRVGILMYGKKASFKELWKWIFYKG